MACNCGTVKVAFARLRAASALKLSWGALLLGSLIFFAQLSDCVKICASVALDEEVEIP